MNYEKDFSLVKVRRPGTTCSACRAYEGSHSCGHGYKVQFLKKGQGVWQHSFTAPAEACPRPITVEQYLNSPKRWELPEPNSVPVKP